MSELSVILVSNDSRGFGSFRRQCAIAAALHHQSPSAKLYLATSCELVAPPYLKILPLYPCAKSQERSYRLLRYIQEYNPNALLIDKHPLGVGKEFAEALHWAHGEGIRCFYGLRDILDHPDRIHSEWIDVLPVISRIFLKVLVYGQKEMFDVAQYGLETSQIEYCGYVSPAAQVIGGTPDGILCTVGRGDCGLAARLCRIFWDCDFSQRKTLVSGPLNNDAFNAKSRHCHITYCPNMHDLWSTHHTVVCLGGYNTLVEAIYYGLHVICIPRVEPRLEQLMRAKMLADRGYIQYIHPEELTTEVLQRAVTMSQQSGGMLDYSGAQHAAQILLHEIDLHP